MYKHLRVKHLTTEELKSHILDDSGQPFAELSRAPATVPVELLQVGHVLAQGSAGVNKSGAELFRCLVCEKMVTKYALKNHLSIHNDETKFKCDLCPKAYSTKSSLANHKVASHQDTKGASFKCSGCFRSFRTERVRDHHATTCLQDTKSKKEAFECRLCHKMFGYKNNLVAHQRSVHGLEAKTIQEYSCKHCKQVIRGKLKLSKHIISAHPDVAGELCDLCGKSFQTEVKLLRHISVHKSRERNLHCSFCPKKFFRKDILMVHEKVHTDPVICIKCGKSFPEQRYLDSHMVLHLDKTHDCLYCIRSFSTQDLLSKHYSSEHSKNENLTFACNFCNQTFYSKHELKKHKSEHSKDFPLKCETCYQGFLHDSQLEKHMDTQHSKTSKLLIFCQHCDEDHSSPGMELASLYSLKRHLMKHKCPMVKARGGGHCDVCAKDPEIYYKLKNHIRVNDSRKVLPCDRCDKRFKTVQDLNTHSVVHTGQKPYSCQLCGDKFTQKCSLKTHYLRHKQGTVGVSSFQCSLCFKECKTYAALKSHQKSHQGGEEAPAAREVEVEQEVVAASFPHLVFQTEGGLPLLLDPSQQFQVTTINIGQEELEVEAAGLDMMMGGGLGEVGEYKIQIINDMPSHSVGGKSLQLQ